MNDECLVRCPYFACLQQTGSVVLFKLHDMARWREGRQQIKQFGDDVIFCAFDTDMHLQRQNRQISINSTLGIARDLECLMRSIVLGALLVLKRK